MLFALCKSIHWAHDCVNLSVLFSLAPAMSVQVEAVVQASLRSVGHVIRAESVRKGRSIGVLRTEIGDAWPFLATAICCCMAERFPSI